MSGFKSPNHTQVPNDFFDLMMQDMDETELRVTLIAIRKTLGYHKDRDAISLTTFIEMTGLSRQGVLDGIEKAKRRGTLIEVGKGKRGINIFELVITDDQSNQLTSQSSRPELVNPVDQTPAVTSQSSRPSKERRKKTPKQSIVRDAVYDAIMAGWDLGDDGTVPRIRTALFEVWQFTDYDWVNRFVKWYKHKNNGLSLPIDATKLKNWYGKFHKDPLAITLTDPIATNGTSEYSSEMQKLTAQRYQEKGLLK